MIISSRLYKVQNHITLWDYSYDAIILGMNKKDWDSLPESDRDMIKQAAAEASREQVRLSREAAEIQESLLRSRGMAVTRLTPKRSRPSSREWHRSTCNGRRSLANPSFSSSRNRRY